MAALGQIVAGENETAGRPEGGRKRGILGVRALLASRFFHKEIGRSRAKTLGFALPPAGLQPGACDVAPRARPQLVRLLISRLVAQSRSGARARHRRGEQQDSRLADLTSSPTPCEVSCSCSCSCALQARRTQRSRPSDLPVFL